MAKKIILVIPLRGVGRRQKYLRPTFIFVGLQFGTYSAIMASKP